MSPASPPSHPQLAVSAAIFRDDRILLVRRARSPAKGFYSLPGGRVEFGETLHAALHREVDEETALKIEIVGLAGWREVVPGAGGGGHYLIMSFAARWIAGEPVLNDELDDFRWLAPDAIGDLKVTGGLQEVIQAARSLLRAELIRRSSPPRLASSALKRHIVRAHVQAFSGRSHPDLGMHFRPCAGPGCGCAVRRRPAAAGRDPRHPALPQGHLRQQ